MYKPQSLDGEAESIQRAIGEGRSWIMRVKNWRFAVFGSVVECIKPIELYKIRPWFFSRSCDQADNGGRETPRRPTMTVEFPIFSRCWRHANYSRLYSKGVWDASSSEPV